MIDRRGNQLGNVLVCLHAVTIQQRGRATRSIDHDTHGHRLGQNKAQTGFEGSSQPGGESAGAGRKNVGRLRTLGFFFDLSKFAVFATLKQEEEGRDSISPSCEGVRGVQTACVVAARIMPKGFISCMACTRAGM